MAQPSLELVELQVADINLLRAAYPAENELIIDSSTEDDVDRLQDWCLNAGPWPQHLPNAISCALQIHLEVPDRPLIYLNISFELLGNAFQDVSRPKPPKVQLRQPQWMTKADVSRIFADMPADHDTVLPIIEYVRDEVTINYQSSLGPKHESQMEISHDPLVRVWFYFPSLSTREKRNDLVNHAPGFDLTGFVLAGKPGVLCLEGQPRKIDDYMKFIKTESWGDIPSHHKKVSERYREEGNHVQRTFSDMSEITDLLGEKRGERGNRSDMKLLEAWLVDKGLGEAFHHVLM